MWQFIMNSPVNENVRADFAGESNDERRINRLLVPACFTAVVAIHLALLSLFDFSMDNTKELAETGELFLTMDFPESSPEESGSGALPLPPDELILSETAVAPLLKEIALSPEETVAEPLVKEIALSPEETVAEPLVKEIALAPEETAAAPLLRETVFTPEEVAAVPLVQENTEAAVPVSAAPAAESRSAESARGAPADTGNTGASNAAGASMTDAEYMAIIMGRLEKNKIYPLSVRKRGIEGDITAAFTIRRDGTVSDLRLADPAGHRFLAQAAFETIRSASPFPVMQDRDGDYTVQVSIRYRLEDAAP